MTIHPSDPGAPRAPVPHGGDLEGARQRFPDAPEPLIDLSTGINPVPYPVEPGPAEEFARLPATAALAALQAVAAAAYGADDPAMVVAAPGTQLLINLLPRVLPQPSIAVLGPTYAEHAPAWRDAGTAVHEVTGFDALERHGAVLLCNPNNPDGRRAEPDVLLRLAVRLLVVDEAFAEFDPGLSLVPRLRDGIVVLRSFGKAYGLAGLRLGFAVATPPTAALIRRALGPWAVGGTALRVGRAALADRAWLDASGARLRADAARLDGLLQGAGCLVTGGTPLFRFVQAPDAAGLAVHLGRRGILVRSFADRPGRLRFGLPGPGHWDRLEDAVRGYGHRG